MLSCHLHRGATKRGSATKPFVDYHAKGVLVTGCSWRTLQLFGGQVGHSSRQRLHQWLCAERDCVRREQSQAKVTEYHLVTCAEQHILRLDVPVDQALVVGVL